MGKEKVEIGSRREVFWDDYMTEPERTTAMLRVHQPVKREMVLHLTMPWEGDGCDYYNILKDDDRYRVYYLGWNMLNPEETEHTGSDIKVCYAETKDGLRWTRPNLGLFEFDGSWDNNIILDQSVDVYDNFFAFKDTNPAALPEEKYKGVAECGKDGTLWGYTSPDAIHWKRVRELTRKGKFDSLNTCFFDGKSGEYRCYIRDFHDNEETDEYGIRDIRVITSKDFWNWSDPVMLEYADGYDYPLYTNNVSPYYRAPHMLTGFPTRYVQRYGWSKNFDRLAGPERRRKRADITERLGTTVTDCVFMSSRDGYHWNRFNEAWLTPGVEHKTNWVYGDCYPALGRIETPGEWGEDGPNEISMYNFEGKWTSKPSRLYRYTIRLDGFASYYAPYETKTITTRPFTFTGSTFKLNFSTSARGFIRVRLLDEDYREIPGFYTTDIFGDRVDSPVDFENGDVATLAGKTVRLEFTLSDADIYSFIFE